MQPFDLLNAPLEGINLIEAGAGTGKTYNIEGLFIRLVLEMQLQVEQILVLTFTNAATEELKDRIRKKLVQAKEAFAGGGSEDPFINSLMSAHTDPQAARFRIHEALIDFDQASIFTIHGFCQRIIHENAFETHNLFDTELVSNQAHLIQQVVDDFWRNTYYSAPVELISFSMERVKDPEYFIRLLEKAKIPDVKIIPELAEPSIDTLQPFRDALNALKKAWPVSREPVIRRLMDPALNANIYGRLTAAVKHPEISDRELRVTSLAEMMDQLVHPQSAGFPLFDNFEKFTAAKLAKTTKKKHTPPQHDFFDLCDTVFTRGELLKAELEQYLMFLKAGLFDFADSELRKRKKEKNIQYFDDLLITVRNALKTESKGHLAAGIRQKYRAALVDEFQDTDSIQYDILTRLFSRKNSLLFMIGDPKQSIYSFRGADIFSYMDAARSTDTKFTLIENWRSEPGLIKAVNTLFSGVKAPFIFDEIPFEKGKPANLRRGPESVKFEGPPLILWYLDPDKIAPTEKSINKPEAVGLIAHAVGDEICRLISGATTVEPGDIAVLVRKNMQAQLIKDILTERNVPSVLYTSANIFDSREALEIERILSGIAHPADITRLKSAFATEIMGIQARELIAGDLESRWWETRLARFRDYFQLWDRHGFIRMFRLFLARESVKDRLLSFSDGERRLTNVMHLAELLHRQSTQKKAGMTGLLKWLAEQRDHSSPRLEEDQLRLESDEQAVKIVTVHKSKGLEYPVVFCPFGWESSLIKSREFAFHDTDNDLRLTVDMGSELRSKNIALAQNELLSENLRLLYVALTRAKQRCYLAWGRINTAETSALAYLLHGGNNERTATSTGDHSRLLKRTFSAKTNAELRDDLNRLAAISQNSIQIIHLPVPKASDAVLTADRQKKKPLFCRQFAGKIDHSWKISSYSALVSAGAPDVDQPDRDSSLYWLEQNPTTASDDLEAVKAHDETTIFSFPGGTRAGSFFHDVFEHLDFAADNSEHLELLVVNKLQQYGFDQRWMKTVCRAISNVLSSSLGPETRKFRLSSIPMGNKISEMEFYFPLNPVTPDSFNRIFEQLNHSEPYLNFPLQLEKLSFAPSVGFMKGYIDLVFRHHGRFYLVDWKSNHLGSTLENYDRSSLNRIMAAEYYFLQYHIYTLAFHQHLRLHQPDYRYENNFGGVFYIFIRGVHDEGSPEYGIFFDLPDPDIIHGLGKTLIPGYNI